MKFINILFGFSITISAKDLKEIPVDLDEEEFAEPLGLSWIKRAGMTAEELLKYKVERV